MAYIVLVLGLVMALIGLGAMASGYPVIEIERGWAMVISGAVLLSGGVVTAALGIVVRALARLNVATETASVRAIPADVARLPAQTMEPLDPPKPATVAPAAAIAPPSLETAPAGIAASTALAAGGELAPSWQTPAAFAPASEPERPDQAPEALERDIDETPPAIDEAEPVDHRSPELDQTTHEPPPPRADDKQRDEPHAQQSEAWLDQAFQAFDYEMTGGHPSPAADADRRHEEPPPAEDTSHHEIVEEPTAQSAPHVHAQADTPGHETEPASHEPVHEVLEPAGEPTAAAPSTAPATAPDNLAVIGRYDSEGTSYVMYSDGSIEAQSEAGVYRFGSMAELKAFIEG